MTVILGRSVEATNLILDRGISRKHALFTRRGDNWIVKNLSLNGVLVNDKPVKTEEEQDLSIGDTIIFGGSSKFTYHFGVKEIMAREGSTSTSQSCSNNKRLKSEDSRSILQTNLSQEHAILEQQLKESDALQLRLEQERNQLRDSLQKQQEQLKDKYQQEKEKLEHQFAAGALAQQVMLKEKESLAQRLKMQVKKLQGRLDEDRKTLEDQLRLEEEQRNHILQEKEKVLHQLEEEKANLERVLEEERHRLQEQLEATEYHKEELRQQLEAKESAILAKEVEKKKAEQEKERLEDELAKERLRLAKELESVKNHYVEKERKNFLLGSMLKEKEESLRTELLSGLQNELQTLEAQNMSLEQELESTAVATKYAREEVVESVSGVLENELQCSICNELLITAITLNCSHTFCRYCIDRWKKNKRECPNCRASITSETRSLVVDNFIEKIVPTLSEEMKKKRADIVAERKAEIEVCSLAQAAAATQRGRRGRRRGARRQNAPNRAGWEDLAQFQIIIPLLQEEAVSVVDNNSRTNIPQGRTAPIIESLPVHQRQGISDSVVPPGIGRGGSYPSPNNGIEAPGGSTATDSPRSSRTLRRPAARPSMRANSGLGAAEDPIVLGANEPLSTYRASQRQGRSQTGGNQTGHPPDTRNPQPQRNEPQSPVPGTSGTITVRNSDDFTDSDSSTLSGDESYYGGYGRCFNCGRRGHWAGGCPYNW
ncbi:E3 ubiquitin-protein ligase rnf8-like isoform X3 [Homarus americanus]|uniref:E3 ubiquitin-protein ligase rnf8-like isoform X3 n=1 Tax=Homarus americanus TaxID=6706 RepID=UPI001C466D14|nr:E3 ubiquitin-protein ligase rnf8-like isoform X3 [Homarus americanus]